MKKASKSKLVFSKTQVQCFSGTIKPYVGPLIDQGINTSRDKLDEDYFHKEVQVEIPIQAGSKYSLISAFWSFQGALASKF